MTIPRIRRALLCALLAGAAGAAHANVDFDFPVNAVASAGNALALSPPLPMLNFKQGDYKAAFQPYIFSGKVDCDGCQGPNDLITGDFKGWSGAASFSYAVYDNRGLFLFAMHNAVTSGDFNIDIYSGNDSLQVAVSQGSLDILGAGGFFHYRMGRRATFGGFMGPMLAHPRFSLAVQESGGKGDFDIEGDALFPGIMYGMQMGIDLGRSFNLNPFMMGGNWLHDMEYSLGDVRRAPQYSTKGSKSISGYYNSFIGLGLNLVYKPWGLAVNVTSPFMGKVLSSSRLTTPGIGVSTYSISLSFGRYQR